MTTIRLPQLLATALAATALSWGLAAVAVVVGSALGSVAGWFGGFVDNLIGRVLDVVLSIPGFLLAITIVAVLGFGIFQSALAVGLTSSATFARLIRSEVLKASTSNYVEAATTSGAANEERVVAALEAAALPADFLNRHPRELSGGQRQRVAIAGRSLLVGT
jgi:ABC-type dipeptide/oligopeptide/nickel transport system permease subunit